MSRPKKKLPEGITARPLKNGTTVYDVKVRLATGELHQPRGFRTLADAVADRDAARADAFEGRTVRNRALLNVTVGELAEAHLKAGREGGWSDRSYEKWSSDWRTLSADFDVPLVALTATDVADWLGRATASFARDTVNGRIALLRAILDRGAADHGVANVARLVRRKRTRRARTELKRRALTPAEAGAVIDAMDDRYRVGALLCLGLGLRSGEARGLTVDRVNFDTGAVRIERQLVRRRVGAKWDGAEDEQLTATLGFAALKTPNSYATLIADRSIVDAIEAHVADFPNPFGLIVSNTVGKPLVDQGWCAAVRDAAKVAGVAFVGHELRHTAGQWTYDATKDLARVAAFLRDDIQTVTNTYVHGQADDGTSSAIMANVAACKPRARGHLRAV